jgi:tetrapyrrole methylase family protein/MazG family protein
MVDFVYKENYGFEDLVKLVKILRSECPWDREQTHRSIRRNLLEEAYEVAEAIDLEDSGLLKEELGDVLLQVVFHAQMEEELGNFDIDEVCNAVCRKLIGRHPHVFGKSDASTPDEVLNKWDEIKRAEKGQATHTEAMESIAGSLPALWRTDKILEKAEKAGFDFATVAGMQKLRSMDLSLPDTEAAPAFREYELGALLFSTVSLARKLKADPERSLEKYNDKFIERFSYMEMKTRQRGTPFSGMSVTEMARLYREAESEKP